MNSSVFESAMQAATHSSAIANAIESTSVSHIAKSMSAASQFERHAKQLSLGVTMSEVASGLYAFGQDLDSAAIIADRLAREELDRITELQRTIAPDVANDFAEMAGQAVSRRASNQLTAGARDMAAQIDAAIGPRALIDSCRPQVEGMLPETSISSVLGSWEAELLDEIREDQDEECFTVTCPIIPDSRLVRPQRKERVTASDLSEPRRSDIGHRHVVVLERALRRFICQRMQEAFGENWLVEKVPVGFRKTWARTRANKESRASEIPLIEFADFGHYVKLIADNDDIWSAAFETVFGNKEETIRLLKLLNAYRRDTSHSRELSPDDLVAFHRAAVTLLTLIAPDAVDELPASVMFVP